MVPVPTNKHCLKIRQIDFPARVLVHPADGPGHVAFVPHAEPPGHPAVPDACAFPDQHRDQGRFLDPFSFAVQQRGLRREFQREQSGQRNPLRFGLIVGARRFTRHTATPALRAGDS
jgi:hypothetical protein